MATVLIWENNMVPNVVRGVMGKLSNNFDSNHTYAGHASMSIDDVWNNGSTPSESFVTWVPTESLGRAYGISKAVTGAQMRHKTNYAIRSLCGDLVLERYLPDHVIRITSLKASKMRAEWNSIKVKTDAHWRQYRKNCSTIVARVLRAGGAGGVAAHNLIWTPLKVKALALKCGGTLMTWDALMKEIEAQDKSLNRSMFEGAATYGGVRTAERSTSGGTPLHTENKFPWRTPSG